MEGGGLIAHPTAGQIIFTVVLVLVLVFLLAAGSQIPEIIKKIFGGKKAKA